MVNLAYHVISRAVQLGICTPQGATVMPPNSGALPSPSARLRVHAAHLLKHIVSTTAESTSWGSHAACCTRICARGVACHTPALFLRRCMAPCEYNPCVFLTLHLLSAWRIVCPKLCLTAGSSSIGDILRDGQGARSWFRPSRAKVLTIWGTIAADVGSSSLCFSTRTR